MLNYINTSPLVVIRGAGDLATGIAHRLQQAGFMVVMLEVGQPTVVRRTVSFADSVYTGRATVEGLTAVKTDGVSSVRSILAEAKVPVLVDPAGKIIKELGPRILVDAIMAKRNTGTTRQMAPLVVAIGPGFTAGRDVDAVVETMRGHYLGKVIWEGSAIPNTGIPGEIGGYGEERLLRAPSEGIWNPLVEIGDKVVKDQLVAKVNGAEVRASIAGTVRGLLYPGLTVHAGMKVGDVDARADREHCFTISDKARAVAGGVLEAVMHGLMNRDLR